MYSILVTLLFIRSTESDVEINCGIVKEIQGDVRTRVPWNAAIFTRPNENSAYKYLVSGIVIGPSTILTLFGRGYGDRSPDGGHYRIPSPTNNLVITGLKSTSFEEWDDQTQLSQISYISPDRSLNSVNKDYHFVLIHLRTPLNLDTAYVQPICLNPNLAHFWRPSKTYNLGGFTKFTTANSSRSKNQILQVGEIKLGGKTRCEELYSKLYQGSPNHVFCGTPVLSAEEESNCIISHGSALVTQVNSTWYLKGVSALIPEKRRGSCNNGTAYFFADPTRIVTWIRKSLECGPTKFYCKPGCIPLRKVCNVEEDCEDADDENQIFCEASSRCPSGTFQCGLHGICFSKDKLCNGVQDCNDGNDELFNVCRTYNKVQKNTTASSVKFEIADKSSSIQTCKQLQISEGVVAKCFERFPEKTNVDCSSAKVGTEAMLTCDNHYFSIDRVPSIKMNCMPDGNWSPFRPFACGPNCGQIGNGFKLNIANGAKTTSEIAFPWYSAIFVWNGSDYTFICGASLVERSALITAAHCVTNDNGELTPNESFRVVFSPISSDYNENLEDRFTQIAEVKAVFVPSSYSSKILQSDIAIMIFKSPVTFGDFVRPICYLIPTYNNIPEPGKVGKIAGLGIDETAKISKVLKYANFPAVSNLECNLSLDRVIPLNTFCAGHKNGTSVCRGDSGGGLVFSAWNGESERYVLKGIVSHSELGNRLCDFEHFAVFTHVDSFSKWILEILAKYQ